MFLLLGALQSWHSHELARPVKCRLYIVSGIISWQKVSVAPDVCASLIFCEQSGSTLIPYEILEMSCADADM